MILCERGEERHLGAIFYLFIYFKPVLPLFPSSGSVEEQKLGPLRQYKGLISLFHPLSQWQFEDKLQNLKSYLLVPSQISVFAGGRTLCEMFPSGKVRDQNYFTNFLPLKDKKNMACHRFILQLRRSRRRRRESLLKSRRRSGWSAHCAFLEIPNIDGSSFTVQKPSLIWASSLSRCVTEVKSSHLTPLCTASSCRFCLSDRRLGGKRSSKRNNTGGPSSHLHRGVRVSLSGPAGQRNSL